MKTFYFEVMCPDCKHPKLIHVNGCCLYQRRWVHKMQEKTSRCLCRKRYALVTK